VDNDCNGQTDENAVPAVLWPDGDGDGYYQYQTGTPKMGCDGVPGYASHAGDCSDSDPSRHPGVKEVCNLKDDNCDGIVDERVRPVCGVGLCARASPTCDAKDCIPGSPVAETCNRLDDDCDGEVDEDSCATGFACVRGACVPAGLGGSSGGAGTGGISGAV